MKLKMASILMAGLLAAAGAQAGDRHNDFRYGDRWKPAHPHKHYKHHHQHYDRHHYYDRHHHYDQHVYYEAPGRYYRYHQHSRHCGHRDSIGRIRVYIGL